MRELPQSWDFQNESPRGSDGLRQFLKLAPHLELFTASIVSVVQELRLMPQVER